MNLRNKQERVEWKKWLKKNRDHLVIVCGVPADIVSDKERWLYLVEHGELDGWNIGMLNDVQLSELRTLIAGAYGESSAVMMGLDLELKKRQ